MKGAVRQTVRTGQPRHGEERTEQQVVAVHQQQRRFGHRERTSGFYAAAGVALAVGAGLGCAPAAWEEHHRLGLDGSGRSVIRVSADLLPGNTEAEASAALREGLSAEGLTVGATRSGRGGQVEAEVTFDSVTALCGAPLLRRDCSYRETGDGGFDLAMTIEPRLDARAQPGEDIEIRVRTEGRISAHNSDRPLQRGNVLSWGRPLDQFLGEGLEVRVRTDGTSVFAATMRIVLRSALIALGIVAVGLSVLILEGRRRLKREQRAAEAESAPDL